MMRMLPSSIEFNWRFHSLYHFAWGWGRQQSSIDGVSCIVHYELLQCFLDFGFSCIVHRWALVNGSMFAEVFLSIQKFSEIAKYFSFAIV
jgi:hypothetical protein